jgi:hypothetical protein
VVYLKTTFFCKGNRRSGYFLYYVGINAYCENIEIVRYKTEACINIFSRGLLTTIMKIAIMQPYLFPYIGYFQLMKNVDRWIVADEMQFIDKGWINRNRILHPDDQKEWIYISIPLKHRGQFDKINKINIDGMQKWKSVILGRLSHYRGKAPYYSRTMDLVNACLANDESNLALFVTNSLRLVAIALGINVKFDVLSELDLKLGRINHAGQWAIKISEALGATEYINPYSGYSIYLEEEFLSRGISLRFLRPRLTPYMQRRDRFVNRLSIIDVMMWNSNAQILKMMTRDFDMVNHRELSRTDGQLNLPADFQSPMKDSAAAGTDTSQSQMTNT